MRRTVLCIVLAALLLFTLCACEASSTSTTTVSTSVTDSESNTTFNSVTNEVSMTVGTDGVTVTEETTTESSGDPHVKYAEMIDYMYETYSMGLEGTNPEGERVLFAIDDPEALGYGQLLVISPDGEQMSAWYGEIFYEEDHFELYSEAQDTYLPFAFTDTDEEDTVILTFLGDGDELEMQLVAQDEIIEDIILVLDEFGVEP